MLELSSVPTMITLFFPLGLEKKKPLNMENALVEAGGILEQG